MTKRIFNFNPGPSTLPLDVLKVAQEELLDYKGTGMSVMEISHRSPEYEEINDGAMALARELMGLDESYHVLFLGGGASTQFAMIPMNFLTEGRTAAYVDTGSWSAKAIKEAGKTGVVHVAGSSKDDSYRRIPKPSEITVPADAVYLHLTSNNTIFGTQYHRFPEPEGIPLMCDMSSDICSRQLSFRKFSLIYAGAQKNLGPAGVTMVIISDNLLQRCRDGIPTMFDYRTHAEKKSLFNTPPAFAVYIVWLVLQWLKGQGGLAAVEKTNRAKQELIYQVVDGSPDFFRGTVEPDSRSWMNITIRLPNEDLEKKFISEAKAAGFGGLKGHRSVGGIRVSLYNAMPLEGAAKLTEFMDGFRKANS
jgi:phosphoserine aminotransferase